MVINREVLDYIRDRIAVLDMHKAKQKPESNHYYALTAGQYELLRMVQEVNNLEHTEVGSSTSLEN